jgi:multiple sugar transport system ATP-binding protein
VEALTMGDRIAVLKDGVLQQVGTPRDLYAKPQNVFVAGFIGSPAMNLFHADLVDGGIKFGTATVPVDRDALAESTGPIATIGVRPEDITVSAHEGEGLAVEVDLVEELGADGYLYGHSTVEGKRTDIVARVDGRIHPNAGEKVYLTATPHHVHVFDAESGERLGKRAIVG